MSEYKQRFGKYFESLSRYPDNSNASLDVTIGKKEEKKDKCSETQITITKYSNDVIDEMIENRWE